MPSPWGHGDAEAAKCSSWGSTPAHRDAAAHGRATAKAPSPLAVCRGRERFGSFCCQHPFLAVRLPVCQGGGKLLAKCTRLYRHSGLLDRLPLASLGPDPSRSGLPILERLGAPLVRAVSCDAPGGPDRLERRSLWCHRAAARAPRASHVNTDPRRRGAPACDLPSLVWTLTHLRDNAFGGFSDHPWAFTA